MCTGTVAVATAASTCELPSQVKTIMYAASEASLSFNDEGHWKWETMLKVLPPPTVCSSGFYADISYQQVQQYRSCLKTFL